MTKQNREKTIDRAVLVLFALLYILISYYHEPWFDEAQAWEIARDGSYKDILFLIPHGEGHPPLWSLILSIPAKLGVPFVWGIKSVAFIFSMATAYLIVFKAPFSKFARYILPFTYFFFYQYGIISRTYCVMMFLLLLAACLFKSKDEHPWRFTAVLALLCGMSAYGIAIAGGICMAWCIDIWRDARKNNSGNPIGNLVSDSRVRALLTLLIFAIILILEIMPNGSTYASTADRTGYLGLKLIYMLLALPGDALISTTFPNVWENVGIIDIIPGIFATVIIWVFFVISSSKEIRKYYFVPEILYAGIMSYYGFEHHSGIGAVLYFFALWIAFESLGEERRTEQIKRYLPERILPSWKRLTKILSSVVLVIMLGFSVASSIEDIYCPYAESTEVANLFREHGMEEALVMSEWGIRRSVPDDMRGNVDLLGPDDYDTNDTGGAVELTALLGRNIVFNHNAGNAGVGYITHLAATDEENSKAYDLWKEAGIPEVLIGTPRLDFVYDDVDYSDYKLVLRAVSRPVWKGSFGHYETEIFVRRDCLSKYDFE